MIKVTYECDETGQEMEIIMTIPGQQEDNCEVKINFDPKVGNDTEDPYGILNKIFNACTGK